MRKTLAVLPLLLAPVLAFAQIPESMDPAAIPNYQTPKKGVATSGQPTPEALKQLKQQGFKTVVNLRAESEPGVKEEAEIVRDAGLNYVLVPITPATLSQDKVDAVAAILGDPKLGPVLVHCASANRVGAVWTVIETQRGRSYDEALAEGRKIGLSSPQAIDAVKKLLGKE